MVPVSFLLQVLSRDFMPKSMLEQYLACDKPPPLDKLNPYREVRFTYGIPSLPFPIDLGSVGLDLHRIRIVSSNSDLPVDPDISVPA